MEKLDLTLKLGLPTNDERVNQYLQDTTLTLRPPMSDDPLWTNTSGGDNKGKSPINMFLGGPYNEGSRNHMDVNLMAFDNITKICSPFAGAAAAVASAGGGAPSGGHGSGEVNRLLAPPIGCVMLDVPARRAERERVFANAFEVNISDAPSSGRGRSRSGDHNRGENNNEHNKRCTNFNCNTIDSPMWRRGPLGPKTLCNACGIKFRKEEERKKAREAAGNRDDNNNNNNGSNKLFINNQFYVNYTN